MTPKVLVVDDAVDLSSLYSHRLELWGYEVDISRSIVNARELIAKKTYNLVIIETMNNDFNQLEDMKRKLDCSGNLPVIVNTTGPDFEAGKTWWETDACILKSFDVDVLREKMDILLDGVVNQSKSGFERYLTEA